MGKTEREGLGEGRDREGLGEGERERGMAERERGEREGLQRGERGREREREKELEGVCVGAPLSPMTFPFPLTKAFLSRSSQLD